MKCRLCDVEFLRPVEVPIPHDRCTRCHEKIEALNEMGKKYEYPNYIVKGWQYRAWLIVGFFLTCFFMVKMLGGANEAAIGVIGFSLMTARLIVLRSRWKRQSK